MKGRKREGRREGRLLKQEERNGGLRGESKQGGEKGGLSRDRVKGEREKEEEEEGRRRGRGGRGRRDEGREEGGVLGWKAK